MNFKILMVIPLLLVFIDAVDVAVRTVLSWVLSTQDDTQYQPSSIRNDPAETLLVVPVILTGDSSVSAAIECIERNISATGKYVVPMAILSDLFDCSSIEHPRDAELISNLIKKLRRITSSYTGDIYLIHRDRTWNPVDCIWMGWERKRGKLQQLNRLILGRPVDSIRVLIGSKEGLQAIKRVITLDVDSTLADGACSDLSFHLQKNIQFPKGALGERRKLAVLQPLPVAIAPNRKSSYFERLWFGAVDEPVPGTSRAGFDLYQHFFSQGSFYGKGIYSVKEFDDALEGAIPENLVLSHDILEGAIAGASMCCDIHVYEPTAFTFKSEIRRRHRWMRGDWQLVPYLTGVFPARYKDFVRPKLSALTKWKLFDNIRRSLTPIAFLLLYMYLVISGAALEIVFIVVALQLLTEILSTGRILLIALKTRQLVNALINVMRIFTRALIRFSVLPTEAWTSIDAIVRSQWRLYVSGRGLLEWQTFDETQTLPIKGIRQYVELMLPNIVCSLVFFSLAFFGNLRFPVVFTLQGGIWLLTPFILSLLDLNRRDEQMEVVACESQPHEDPNVKRQKFAEIRRSSPTTGHN